MKRKQWIIVLLGGVAVVALLAAGAYTAVRLLADEDAPARTGGPARVMEEVMDNGNGPVSVRTTFLPAAELPDEAPAATGIVVSRQDNSVIVGTGNVDVMVQAEIDPETGEESRTVVPRTSGPEVEIVIGPDTVLYRDVTDFSADAPTESGEREVQQVVRPANSADAIEPQMEVQVWGERRGDRIDASVVVFGPVPGF